MTQAVTERGRADWATTGGSTIVGIYRELAAPPLRDAVPWDGVHVWWGDDRFVPRDHPLSNVAPFDDILVDVADLEEGTGGPHHPGVQIPVAQVHPFRTTEAIGAFHSTRTIDDQVAGGGPVAYGKFLAWRKMLTVEPPRRPEPNRPSSSAAGRFGSK